MEKSVYQWPKTKNQLIFILNLQEKLEYDFYKCLWSIVSRINHYQLVKQFYTALKDRNLDFGDLRTKFQSFVEMA